MKSDAEKSKNVWLTDTDVVEVMTHSYLMYNIIIIIGNNVQQQYGKEKGRGDIERNVKDKDKRAKIWKDKDIFRERGRDRTKEKERKRKSERGGRGDMERNVKKKRERERATAKMTVDSDKLVYRLPPDRAHHFE